MMDSKPNKKIKVVDIVGPAKAVKIPIEIPAPKKSEIKKEKLFSEESRKTEKIIEKFGKEVEKFEKKEIKRFQEEEGEKKERKKKEKNLAAILVFGFLILILAAGGGYAALKFFSKSTIKLVVKKEEWKRVDSVIASKNAAEIDFGGRRIPAEVFSQKKNFTFSFPATGKKTVERKASGKITIYNSYSSEPQPLIEKTRFVAPDGKIFRLVSSVTVPGAKVTGGKIVPSSVEAAVAAEQPGPQYNIGPVSRFSIPGLQATPKYQGFYAESKEPFKGGFIGEAAFPTESDVKKAKEEAVKNLRESIDSFLTLQMPKDFKVIDGARQFKILKEELNSEVDEKGNFTFFAEAESSSIAFKEADVIEIFESFAKENIKDGFGLKNYGIEYGAGRPDFKTGQISFAVDFSGVFEKTVDIEDFKQKAAGKKESGLRDLIYSMSDIEKSTISFWPKWVKKTPINIDRIKVEIE